MDANVKITSVSPTVQQNAATKSAANNISAHETIPTENVSDKYLEPDQVNISASSQQKLKESTESERNENEPNKLYRNVTTDKSRETKELDPVEELDKKIRELSSEILALSVKIEMLKSKDDKASIKERIELEVELAIKKGTLEAAIEQKMQLIAA